MTIVGTSLPYYLEEGLGERVVLMLHGIGGGHQAFGPQLRALAAGGWRALAWDMPGYGYSRSVSPYTIETLATSCLELIDVLEADQLVLLGHSMGGMIAQEVAARAPSVLAGLVLAGTTAAFGKPDGQWQRAFLSERLAPLEAGRSMADLAPGIVKGLVGRDADPEVLRIASASIAAVPPASYRQALLALVEFDRREALGNLAVPTLVVAGALDQNAPPAVMEKMAARIPGAQFAIIPGAGHLMHWEEPEAFNRLVLEFLEQSLASDRVAPAP